SSAVSTSICAKPSASTTWKPPASSPNVGNAVFGRLGSTTRGVPSQPGFVQTPMLVPNAVNAPGTVTSPFVPPNAITGMSMFAACVRFSMSRRPRPTESADESRLIAWLHCAAVEQALPTAPTVQTPEVQTPVTDVTLRPELG